MLYSRCERLGIPYNKCGKLVVATTRKQIEYLDNLHTHTQDPLFESWQIPGGEKNIGVPTYFLSADETLEMEPDLGRNVYASMYSPESGVVDSHKLMESLEIEITGGSVGDSGAGATAKGDGNDNGSVVLGTKVVRIDPYRDESGGE